MSSIKNVPERDEISQNHKWDLSLLFKSTTEWEALFDELESKIEEYRIYKGRLSESIKTFKEAIDIDLEISRKIERLYTYAQLKSDEDKTNQENQGLCQRAISLHTRISELSSFISPEIQSIPDVVINEFMGNDELKEYIFYLEKILRYRPHTLKEEVEEVIAMSREIAYAPIQFFRQLDNADLKFGTLEDEEGNVVELSHGNFINFLMSRKRAVREKAFFQYYKAYEEHKYCIASSLSSSIKKDNVFAKIRKFDNCRSAALFPDNISELVYDNLIQTVKKHLTPVYKFLDFKKRSLGLNDLHYYDLYAPIVDDIKFNMPYDEGVDICIEALKPLGSEYTNILRKGLLGGWVDIYENRGKRSGAYSSGCYDSPPYILLNYHEDNINSLYTLIHEAGHSMHTYYSVKNQPYIYHDYTIFVAEVASTFNELLLSRYLLKRYKDDNKMKRYILNREIDSIRATLFRQTMFAEFEKITHNMVEESKPLTLDTFTNIYMELLNNYFGGKVVIDEPIKLECLRIPHFYSPYYVYKYATGISASIALTGRVQDGDRAARNAYFKFLSLGGSMFPLDVLLAAGVDMKNEEPIVNAVHYFENLVEKLMEIYSGV